MVPERGFFYCDPVRRLVETVEPSQRPLPPPSRTGAHRTLVSLRLIRVDAHFATSGGFDCVLKDNTFDINSRLKYVLKIQCL